MDLRCDSQFVKGERFSFLVEPCVAPPLFECFWWGNPIHPHPGGISKQKLSGNEMLTTKTARMFYLSQVRTFRGCDHHPKVRSDDFWQYNHNSRMNLQLSRSDKLS